MSSKKRKLVNGALLGAAATALTVKGALTGPLGVAADAPLNDAKQGLGKVKEAAVENSRQAVGEAQLTLHQAMLSPGAGRVGSARAPGSGRGVPLTAVPKPTQRGQAQASESLDVPKDGRPYSRTMLRKIIHDAAVLHDLDPKLILALSFWESGWDQTRVSATGAVGLLQVEPDTASEAGPALLGRQIDLNDPYDNADVGAAIFRQYLDAFGTPAEALAAYYQGPTSLRANGMLPDTQSYVLGILDLAARMSPDGIMS
jgi:transglycosylase-like protein with SLT domain